MLLFCEYSSKVGNELGSNLNITVNNCAVICSEKLGVQCFKINMHFCVFRCLLQESTVTSLYRRRVARNTFRSTEELRPRPYPTARCSRSPHSPRSPRASSLPRVQPMSPLKFPNGTAPHIPN